MSSMPVIVTHDGPARCVDQALSGLIRGIPPMQRLLNVTRSGAIVADSNLTFTWSAGPDRIRVTAQPSAGVAETMVAVAPMQRTVTEFPARAADRFTATGSGSGSGSWAGPWPGAGAVVVITVGG
jgi:hypothetical protein